MKANRRFVNNDDAVSPVIAVILMVAITVVLAATVYLWVSGFGSNQQQLVQASFGAKAVDVPNGDSDSSDDVIQITYVSGPEDMQLSDITISIDGQLLTYPAAGGTGNLFQGSDWAVNEWCTTPGDADGVWERGAGIYLFKLDAAGGTEADECDFASTFDEAELDPAMDSVHQLTVTVKGQVVLDTSIEVHDNPAA
jgi:flagellin-like protein